MAWLAEARQRRARRARDRQADYQVRVAARRAGQQQEVLSGYAARALAWHSLITRLAPLPPNPRVIEVGSGPIGLTPFLPDAGLRLGTDPLAHLYRRLYAGWELRNLACTAAGEALPIRDAAFDLAICDNVVDHAEQPERILDELVRVLRPGGVLVFTVNVHHPVYQAASTLHGAWNAVGIPFEIGPFADHTVHFTPTRIRRLIRARPLAVLHEDDGRAAAAKAASTAVPRHAGDRLKRWLFKNARYVVVARRLGTER